MENRMLFKKLLFVILIGLCIVSCSKNDNNTEENTALSMIQGKWIEDPTYSSIENFVYTFEPNGVVIHNVYDKMELKETYYATYVIKGNKLYATGNDGETYILTIKTLTTKKLVLANDADGDDGETLTFVKY